MQVREVAYLTLSKIFKEKQYSNLALNEAFTKYELNNLDKGFLTNLIYGVLKKNIYLDYVIKQIASDKKIKNDMRTLLKMSIYQILFMDKVPNYAIINEGVNLAKSYFGYDASRFLNALLRKVSSDDFNLVLPSERDEYLSVYYSTPLYIIKMFKKHYGEENLIKYLEENNLPRVNHLRVNYIKTSKEEMLKLPYFKEGSLSKDGLIYTGKDGLSEVKEIKEGKVVIQDEASQMVSFLVDPIDNDNILDMTAAPGSKSFHMASLNQKCHITSVDLYEHRINMLRNKSKLLGIKNINSIVYDSLKLLDLFKEESFDKVLLDAPCSGLGVIGRKPDILIQNKQESLDEIIALQKGLIDVATKLVKKNGYLIYSTCTLNKKENDLQVDYIISKGYRLINKQTIFNFEYHSDGFFMAKLERIE